jgi:hypothetical protein
MIDFESLKKGVLEQLREIDACSPGYEDISLARNMKELCDVAKRHFRWGVKHGIITSELINRYADDFAENDMYSNISVNHGFLLLDNCSVDVFGYSTVVLLGESKAVLYHYSRAFLYDKSQAVLHHYSHAFLCDKSQARLYDYSQATLYEESKAKLHDYSSAQLYDESRAILYDKSSALLSVFQRDGYSSPIPIDRCRLYDKSICREKYTGSIYYASKDLKIERK